MRSGTIPLSETVKFIVDNRGKTAPTAGSGIPLIATNCISNDRLYPAYDKLRYVSQQTYDTWFRSHPQPGDIILTNKGSQNGAICLVPDPVDFVIAQDMVALRANENVIDPLFLFAALRSIDVQREIKNLDVSGVIPHFKKTDFDKLHLPYPDRHVQNAIGRIYFAFCAKIEINRRMNRTLESIAGSIFKSWFVDFDAVRAKAAGQQPPGLAPRLAALFPDAFEESKLGEIPKDWRLGKVEDIADINGWTLGRQDSLDVIDYIEISEVLRGEVSMITRYNRGEEPSRARRRLRHGDTVLSTVRPDRGAYFLAMNPSDSSIASTGFAVLTSKDGNWAFLHALTTRPQFGEELGHLADGGAYPAIRPEVVGSRDITLPPDSLLIAAFEKIAQPLYLQAGINRNQSHTLATLRDALLPKLISGELRVPDAARIVGRAV